MPQVRHDPALPPRRLRASPRVETVALKVVPLTLKQLNHLVDSLHRHHKPVQGHRFSLGCLDGAGELVGACSVGRPVSRGCDPYSTAEVTRLVTDGTKNACSILYGAAARACQAMGFEKIQTYVLESEPATSLKAAGWKLDGVTAGGQWVHTKGKERRSDQPLEPKQRWVRHLAHVSQTEKITLDTPTTDQA
jgi:hypothetical protein